MVGLALCSGRQPWRPEFSLGIWEKVEGNGFGCAHPNCTMAEMRINKEVEKETSIVSLLSQSLNS